ncbi:putative NADP(+)-dependent dehydrogenase [Xylariales sp. AK1849]|nr:putative NADP(+)-dependent dehydrogenase [Xylariales sp. AK1849]
MSFFASWPRPTETYHTTTYDRISKQNGFDGKGRTVLITGGASGVGYSIARAFASAGVERIAIVSRSSAPQQKAKSELEAAYLSTQVLLYQSSITDHLRMAEILQELGRVDVLVLCASVVHRRAPATELSTQEVQDAFDTNVVGTFNFVKAYLSSEGSPGPTHRRVVINVSSAAAQVQGTLRIGYGSSKAAAAQVMQHFAVEQLQESEDGVNSGKVISFHPGSFYTPSVAEHYPSNHFQWDDIDLPGDFALWLAGPESDFLNGRYVWAHWDVDELIKLREKCANDRKFLTIGLIM